jgi:hypothetical protein
LPLFGFRYIQSLFGEAWENEFVDLGQNFKHILIFFKDIKKDGLDEIPSFVVLELSFLFLQV